MINGKKFEPNPQKEVNGTRILYNRYIAMPIRRLKMHIANVNVRYIEKIVSNILFSL